MEFVIKKDGNTEILKCSFEKYNISLLNIGGSIYKIEVKNKNNIKENIVLSYSDLESYKNNGLYLGANIGRFAGRLENGEIEINQRFFLLQKNEGNFNFLHGGSKGFHTKKLNYKIFKNTDNISIKFFGNIYEIDDGIPGDIELEVEYILHNDNIKINYFARSNKDTILNITNHSYFNLSGNNKYNIKEHILTGNIYKIWKINKKNIPKQSHKINSFSEGKSFGEFIKENYPDILLKKGIDNPFDYKGSIKLEDKKSKRILEFTSSYNNLVIYTQHNVNNNQFIENSLKDGIFQGVALEFQNLPNDVNGSFLKKEKPFYEFINIKIK